ncbi:hypothetical protein Scep_024321 [Stephania cephalantha]|uniref:Regulator of telomere elongation helicase 1 homolog n=1 Tax=Stephania cephalantha TaxID=152367 RepID=A0AAP0HY59_9MAGN
MPIYKIRGIDVDFPFEAYDCQIVYMEKVIQSLQELEMQCFVGESHRHGENVVPFMRNAGLEEKFGRVFNWGKELEVGECAGRGEESEAGKLAIRFSVNANANAITRKKVSFVDGLKLVSAVDPLAWNISMSDKPLNTAPEILLPKMGVLGSREQLCIHDEVRLFSGKAQNNACQYLCRIRECSYHSRFLYGALLFFDFFLKILESIFIWFIDYIETNPGLGDDPVDIEELVNIGRTNGPCPYYLSRELHKVVDILFTPYNYLIDRRNRDSLSVLWKDSVLIFDEAHNLESICADAASFDLPSGLVTACVAEAKKCIDISMRRKAIEKSNEQALNPDSYAILRALLLKLDQRIGEVPIESKELGFTRPGPYIYELLADLNITLETSSMLIETIESGVQLLVDAENESKNERKKAKGTVFRLATMADILQIIFKGGKSRARSYRVHVSDNEVKSINTFAGRNSRTLSWWCFNPGITMEAYSDMSVGSIILTSGTLSPLDSLALELKLEFPVRLENPHVISSNQVWAGVLATGPSGSPFNSSYRNRDSLEYKQELGNAIANFARIVPDGLLVFFPSYYLLDQCIGCWKNMGHAHSTNSSTIWERICKHKHPVIEPKQSSLFPSSIEEFMNNLKDTSTSGAVFFAVCRGKVSEGLDFADHAGRAVVVTGIPFATRNDPKVRLKREYLDQQAQLQKNVCKVLTGEEWYSQQASRAVNQAVGRVIRHRHDYGAMIFCDERLGCLFSPFFLTA